ncbi:cobaltochelatase CobN [Devosia enhydra]|uniref:Cobaltochelatase subunit CobN n=1 Tax=Devosia enhydra TaxID=665118 RepID=A0A1K2HX86_9HYPH|nr:cobaltochelatase subunit CobN [Devosia enhydra]SFZ84229.1 cobaltochelatase CobN [Devosia enhydra]
MHLLAAQAGSAQQEGEAIDLGQSPGPMVFAGAADSELALLAGAADRAGEHGLRLASTLRVSHNLSIDLWLQKTVTHARLVVVRLLGGAAYFAYGVNELEALCRNRGIALAFLPGDATPDRILRDRSTIPPEDWALLHRLFTAGGPDNADAILATFRRMAGLASSGTISTKGLEPQPFSRFGHWHPERGMVSPSPADGRPIVPILFYRAVLEGGGTATVTALIEALEARGLTPLPLFVSSLKEKQAIDFVQDRLCTHPPDVILNLTGFALGIDGLAPEANPFAPTDAPVIQLLQSGRPEAQWQTDIQGLTAKDLAMQVVLPELDGRIGMLIVGHKSEATWHARTQCPISSYAPDTEGVLRAATLAENWSRLRRAAPAERRIGIVLANYPIRDGRLANGVGYDAPASTIRILEALKKAGYSTADLPADGKALIARLQAGPTNADPSRPGGISFALADYHRLFSALPARVQAEVTARWGDAADDPFVSGETFRLPGLMLGSIAVLLQPARGYHLDIDASYHDPDLVPPHGYIAAYLWLRHGFSAHAVIHNGKHGSLEWLPGKATALDAASYPATLWAELPQLYPFIVNDPGEGTQAKRRTGAVIIDHLVPPLTRAETYGPLKDLEALLDEYYAASGMDRRRLKDLTRRILDLTRDSRLDADLTLSGDDETRLRQVDTYICELKEAQIRDGLHIFGEAPRDRLETDLLVAFARVPRGERPGDASLVRALADDLKLGIDPLTADLGTPWAGPVPECLSGGDKPAIRSAGKLVEALEVLAADLVSGKSADPEWTATAAVLAEIEATIRPRLRASGPGEIAALLAGLNGRFVAPGPSGAPTRGRLDVLPTGRNFYSVDIRAVPTPTAWELGQRSAEAVLNRHFQQHGNPLRTLVLSLWGTANMRTGGDDVAQALAFLGVRPTWDPASLRLSGYEIIPLAKLARPRVDITLRISGFFRDAFPAQIALLDRAIRAVGALDEPDDDNPVAARMRAEALGLMAEGASEAEAARVAGQRIFGSKPGAYGAGLQGLIDSGAWDTRADLAEAVLEWGQYAYGAREAGSPARARFALRLSQVEAVVHNQDNREHDLLDSDDYYQFEGGLIATAEALSGRKPTAYHTDTSRPERPIARTLEDEIGRVMRSRVVNPKWIAGVMRHGYKGAFEIVATLDYMFAFAATAGAVKSHHFDLAFAAFVEDDAVRGFLIANNRHGYHELLQRFDEARRRGFWTPRSNSAYAYLEEAKP